MKFQNSTYHKLMWAILVCLFLSESQAFSQTIERITIGESSGADQLNPFTNFSATGSYVNEYLYSSLLRTDKETGSFLPLLALGLPSISEDQMVLTYQINPLAKFNTGKHITASDVIFSLKLVRNPFVNNAQKRGHFDIIKNVEEVDEETVKFTLNKPNSQALRITGEFAILAEAYFDEAGSLREIPFSEVAKGPKLNMIQSQALQRVADRVNTYGSSFQAWEAAPTCGPYILTNWKRGTSIVLSANKKFWGKKISPSPNDYFKVNVAEIRIEIADEQTMRKGVFENRYDLVSSMPQALFSNLSEIPVLSKNYDFLSPPGPSYEYIGINMRPKEKSRNLGLAELKVRKALAHLVYVDLLMEEVCHSLGTRIAAEYPVLHPNYRNGDLAAIPFDIETAKKLLDEAGWKDEDGNGIREKNIDGEEVSLVLECIINEGKVARKQIAEHIQKNGREAGILISIVELPWDGYLKRLKAGNFDLSIGAWVPDPNEDSYQQIWHSKSWGTGSNFVGFGNPGSDKLIELYDETIEEEPHRALCMEIQRLIYQEQPYIFLWSNNQCLALNKRFSKSSIYKLRPGFWLGSWE